MPTQELGSSYCLLQMHKLSHKPKRKKNLSGPLRPSREQKYITLRLLRPR